MSDNRTKSVFKNSTASLLQRFVQILTHFALRTVFINFLGNEYTGVSGLFTDILQVLSLMELGLDASMIYSLYEPIAKHDKRRISALLNFYRNAFNIIGVLVLISGVCCTPFLQYIVKDVPSIHEDIRVIFLLYVATSAFSYFIIYKSLLLRADQKSRVIYYISSATDIVESIADIIILIMTRSFYAYLILHFIATVGKNVIISTVSSNTYREYFNDTTLRLTKAEKLKLYKDLACLTIYNLAGVVINSTDSIFISAFVGTVEVAIIGNFTLLINNVRTAVNQIVNATKPSIGNLAATSSNDKQEIVFKRMNFLAFWVACCCCTCFYNLLNPFVGNIWFNESYKISERIIAVLVVNFYIAVMAFPVESFRGANGLFVQGWIRPAIMAVLNIVLDFFWGKAWGIFGILIATTVSRLSTQAWYDPWLIHRKVFDRNVIPYYRKYLLYACITAASCVAVYFICRNIPIRNVLLDFSVKALVSILIPNIIILIVYRSSDEYQYVIGLICKFLKRKKKQEIV